MYFPGLPYHVVQRGNNREPCFIELENYQFYLELWRTVSSRYGVAVHAYCLMTNHIHFLATPESKTSLSNTMKVIGSRYAQYINLKYKRTGTLWEGRHRSSLVQTDRYLLACMRYIELNPVRAGMVDRPEEYKWSSYGINAWADEGWLKPHAEYLALNDNGVDRYSAYRGLFKSHLSGKDLELIRKAAHYCQPVGNDQFRREIEEKYDVKLGQLNRGRPKKPNPQVVKE
jgi:putative transposase